MFFVLVIHANFLSNEAPTTQLVLSNPMTAYTQYFFASISFTCVNTFVLISGWFGISFRWRGLCSLLFQCIFWGLLCYGITLILDDSKTLSIKSFFSCLMIYEEDYWFVKSYLLLYLLSPVLNTFTKHTTKNHFQLTLISFYVFQSIFGWATYAVNFFEEGYSTISFIGLYLTARYTRLHSPQWSQYQPKTDFMIILFIILSTSIISFVTTSLGINIIWIKMYSYVNPIIIFESLLLVVFFSKIHFHSKIINWIATSAFAVYLLHCNVHVFRPYYVKYSQYIFHNYSGIDYLAISFIFMLIIFIAAVLIDKLRIIGWNHSSQLFNHT